MSIKISNVSPWGDLRVTAKLRKGEIGIDVRTGDRYPDELLGINVPATGMLTAADTAILIDALELAWKLAVKQVVVDNN